MSKLKEGPLYSMFRKLRKKIRECLFKSLFVFPMQKKIVFISYLGTKVNCNPRFIYDELKRRNIDCDLIWAVTEPDEYNFRCVKYKSLAFYYHLATAKIRISNTRLFSHWPKRKGQLYIQTWHSGLGLKKSEAAARDSLPIEYVNNAIYDASITDLMISNSKFFTTAIREDFWYKGEILECGLPREDIFKYNKAEILKKVQNSFKIKEENTKLLLYAPTFRKDYNIDCYNINFAKLLKCLNKENKCNWKVLVRLHPNMQKRFNELNYGGDIIDATQYDEINELIVSSDILITDYSSCMFDGMISGSKVFIYATDIEDYIADRNFKISLDELPFPISTNMEELLLNIGEFDPRVYEKKCFEFKQKVGLYEYGNGSAKVADWIIEKL